VWADDEREPTSTDWTHDLGRRPSVVMIAETRTPGSTTTRRTYAADASRSARSARSPA
jgi:hypothetical protein